MSVSPVIRYRVVLPQPVPEPSYEAVLGSDRRVLHKTVSDLPVSLTDELGNHTLNNLFNLKLLRDIHDPVHEPNAIGAC